MNLTFQEAKQLLSKIHTAILNEKKEILIFPNYLYLGIFTSEFAHASFKFGAQNCSEFESGTYTGEISASMIKNVGASYCLVGHSERRIFFSENNIQLKSKLKRCLENDITPVYCIGETLEQRNNGTDRKSTRLNSSHTDISRMPSSA